MFPHDYEKTLTLKEFADYIGGSYWSARRIMIKFGGYRNIGNQNPNYETRRITLSRAAAIKRAITKPENGGRP